MLLYYFSAKSGFTRKSKHLKATIPHIFSTLFGAQLFSTQKRINRDNTDFVTKHCKLQQTWFCNFLCINCDKTLQLEHIIYLVMMKEMVDVDKFLHICHVEKFFHVTDVDKFQISPHLSCIEIWNVSTWQICLHISHMWDMWQIWGMGATQPPLCGIF